LSIFCEFHLKPWKDVIVRKLFGSVFLAGNADVDEDGALLNLLERLELEVPLKIQL
jgi:hypothetical protein